MSLERCLTEKDGIFTSLSRLQDSEPLLESIVGIQGVGTLQFYSVDTTDLGFGFVLDNGRFANPVVIDNPQVATNTADIATNAADIVTNAADIATLQADNPNSQTGISYTLALGDENKTVWMNNAAPNTLSIPLNATEGFNVNTVVMVMMEGAGITSIQAVAGVTLNGLDNGFVDVAAINSGATLVKRGTNAWVITGSISEVV